MAAPLATREDDDAASDASTSEDDATSGEECTSEDDAASEPAAANGDAANEDAPPASEGPAAAEERLPGRGPDKYGLDVESEFRTVREKTRNWTQAVKQAGLVLIDDMYAP